MQKGMTKWLSNAERLSWVMAGHQSAPVGLEWLSWGLNGILTRIDLGKMMIDPRPSFQPAWLNQKRWYQRNVQKDVEYRDAKGWLSTKLGFSWTSVSTCGSRMVVLGLKWNFDTH